MGQKSRKFLGLIAGILVCVLFASSGDAMAARQFDVRAGQSCKSLGQVQKAAQNSFVCTRVRGKLVWRRASMSTQVANLQQFIANHAQSVVTVSCNGSQGSGVSIAVHLPAESKARGIQSYIVTNQHVIFDCLVLGAAEQMVTVTHNGVEYVGYLVAYPSWNDVQAGRQPDLAAIHTTALVPAAYVVGVKSPQLGHAVVAVGSAGGVAGVTTRGEVAGVTGTKIVTTAPAGHGSSGGALFNNQGQLLGFITAANASLVEVTPITQLCSWVLGCSSGPITYVP